MNKMLLESINHNSQGMVNINKKTPKIRQIMAKLVTPNIARMAFWNTGVALSSMFRANTKESAVAEVKEIAINSPYILKDFQYFTFCIKIARIL